jgi:hypothetical protein
MQEPTAQERAEMDAEVVPPGGVGARHVDLAFQTVAIKRVIEMATRDGRPLLVMLLERYIRRLERDFYRREDRIRAQQAAARAEQPEEPEESGKQGEQN